MLSVKRRNAGSAAAGSSTGAACTGSVATRRSVSTVTPVIPAKAGIHSRRRNRAKRVIAESSKLDSRIRGNDGPDSRVRGNDRLDSRIRGNDRLDTRMRGNDGLDSRMRGNDVFT